MRRDELRQAVERPAQRVGLRVEPELADALVADVEGEPGALPLLSTALLEIWQQRDGTPPAPRGVRAHRRRSRGSRAARRGRVSASSIPRQQAVARSALVRLAAEGPGGSGRAPARAAAPSSRPSAATTSRGSSSCSPSGACSPSSAGSVEVAHEALLREWPRLRGWIEDDREGLRIHRGVTAAAEEWLRLDRDEGALYRGTRLTEAREWRDVATSRPSTSSSASSSTRATRAGSGERAARRRRIRIAFGGLTAALAAITAVAIVALYQGREAERQRDIAVSQRLAATATNALEADPALSLTLALRAWMRRGPRRRP